ncbi:MAG: T9SS type A sorting domain-containing protein [Flavobacteriales bacterium]|jgi:hypothetical protein|nr:T9SS type A sorting domain-containing protein [Flavobacteriales bacterium]
MHLRATSILVFVAVLFGTVQAQEHPFLSAYALTELPNGVLVNWTIHGGSTCDGQEVQRSTDSVNFVPVHTIEGICGSPESSTPYTWFDPTPPELSKVYYRIKLGFDGYSSVKSVFYAQLDQSQQRFFPNPVRDEATLVLNVSLNSTLDIRIWNAGGEMVMERSGLVGPAINLDLQALPAGPYIYRATSGAKNFNGRFVKN